MKYTKSQRKKKKHLKGKKKIPIVMKEFKRGTLHSGSGRIVKNRKQAIAIAMSEAGMSRKKQKRNERKFAKKLMS